MTIQPLKEPEAGLWAAIESLRGRVVETEELPDGTVRAAVKSGRSTHRAIGRTRDEALRKLARLVDIHAVGSAGAMLAILMASATQDYPA